MGYESPWLVSACSIDDIPATKIDDGEQIAFLNHIARIPRAEWKHLGHDLQRLNDHGSGVS